MPATTQKKPRPKKSGAQQPNLDHIIEPLRPLAMPVGDIQYDPANARNHNERSIDAVAKSLREFGQRKPIVLHRDPTTGDLTTKAGNGTLAAAIERLGWTHIAAVAVEEDPRRSNAYAIADNRTGELSDWDYKQLTALLPDLLDGDDAFDLDSMGWTQEEVDNFLKADWKPPDLEPLPDGGSPEKGVKVSMTQGEHEIVERACARLKKLAAVPKDAPEGLCIAHLAQTWLDQLEAQN